MCDGAVRDVGTLAGWDDFSVYARWITPRGPSSAERGAVNLPVVIGGRLVTPGDLVIGDDDGLVALAPATIRTRIGDAEAKLAREAELGGEPRGRPLGARDVRALGEARKPGEIELQSTRLGVLDFDRPTQSSALDRGIDNDVSPQSLAESRI